MVMKAKKILVVVAYDISDNKRRAKVVNILERYGTRINFSVFECVLTDRQYAKMRNAVDENIVLKEDKIVYYPICMNCYAKVIYRLPVP